MEKVINWLYLLVIPVVDDLQVTQAGIQNTLTDKGLRCSLMALSRKKLSIKRS